MRNTAEGVLMEGLSFHVLINDYCISLDECNVLVRQLRSAKASYCPVVNGYLVGLRGEKAKSCLRAMKINDRCTKAVVLECDKNCNLIQVFAVSEEELLANGL